METSKCKVCGGLNRIRGSVLHVEQNKDEVWQQVLRCTICGNETRRPFTHSEYVALLQRKDRRGENF